MIYFITDGECTKIGYTDRDDIAPRMADLQIGNPRELRLIGVMSGGRNEEALLHRILREFRVRGEWFKLTGDGVGNAVKIVAPSVKYIEETNLAYSKLNWEPFGRRNIEAIASVGRTKATDILRSGVVMGLWKPIGRDKFIVIRDIDAAA